MAFQEKINEHGDFFVNKILYPMTKRKFDIIDKGAKKRAEDKPQDKTNKLKELQKLLATAPDWDQTEFLEEDIQAFMNKCQKKFDTRFEEYYNDIKRLIHDIYKHCSKKLFKEVGLFTDKCSATQKEKNKEQVHSILIETIQEILKNFSVKEKVDELDELLESEISENESETSESETSESEVENKSKKSKKKEDSSTDEDLDKENDDVIEINNESDVDDNKGSDLEIELEPSYEIKNKSNLISLLNEAETKMAENEDLTVENIQTFLQFKKFIEMSKNAKVPNFDELVKAALEKHVLTEKSDDNVVEDLPQEPVQKKTRKVRKPRKKPEISQEDLMGLFDGPMTNVKKAS